MDTLAIIAIITSLGSLCVIFGKTIKKSSCFGSNCETRTPQPSIQYIPPTPQTTPQTTPQITKKNIYSEIEV